MRPILRIGEDFVVWTSSPALSVPRRHPPGQRLPAHIESGPRPSHEPMLGIGPQSAEQSRATIERSRPRCLNSKALISWISTRC